MVLRSGCGHLIQSDHSIAGGLTPKFQHGEQVVRTTAHAAQCSDFFRNHAQFFEVYEIFNTRIVAQVDER